MSWHLFKQLGWREGYSDKQVSWYRLISIHMPVYMSSLMNASKHIYTITLCLCVSVCAYPRVQFSSRLILTLYLLGKRRYCRVEGPLKNRTQESCVHSTHTLRVIVYIFLQHSLMTTCRPASVLILIYVSWYIWPKVAIFWKNLAFFIQFSPSLCFLLIMSPVSFPILSSPLSFMFYYYFSTTDTLVDKPW